MGALDPIVSSFPSSDFSKVSVSLQPSTITQDQREVSLSCGPVDRGGLACLGGQEDCGLKWTPATNVRMIIADGTIIATLDRAVGQFDRRTHYFNQFIVTIMLWCHHILYFTLLFVYYRFVVWKQLIYKTFGLGFEIIKHTYISPFHSNALIHQF